MDYSLSVSDHLPIGRGAIKSAVRWRFRAKRGGRKQNLRVSTPPTGFTKTPTPSSASEPGLKPGEPKNSSTKQLPSRQNLRSDAHKSRIRPPDVEKLHRLTKTPSLDGWRPGWKHRGRYPDLQPLNIYVNLESASHIRQRTHSKPCRAWYELRTWIRNFGKTVASLQPTSRTLFSLCHSRTRVPI